MANSFSSSSSVTGRKYGKIVMFSYALNPAQNITVSNDTANPTQIATFSRINVVYCTWFTNSTILSNNIYLNRFRINIGNSRFDCAKYGTTNWLKNETYMGCVIAVGE